MTLREEVRRWSENLHTLGAARLRREGWPGSFAAPFRDEHGHRRLVDGPFLEHVSRAWGDHGARGSEALSLPGSQGPDVDLWSAVASGAPAPEWLDEAEAPLSGQGRSGSVEVFTEIELSALHALWWLNLRDGARYRQLVEGLAVWHMEHLQPDNATGHPWAIHVFALLGLRGCPEAMLHAEGLLHAALVATGEPDLLSALILLDAARALASAGNDISSGSGPTPRTWLR
ncbi:MAG: hypothetical protein H6811_11435 [Phycisphaeraceae bacterium]|nr:hypothetical protein [Phycisphaeraceae bacterium]